MATNSSTGNLLPGEIKKQLPGVGGQSNISTSISQTTNLLVSSNQSTTNTTQSTTTTTTAEVKIEKIVSSSVPVNAETRWIFPLEKIEQSPSRLDGITKENELTERQEAALFINDLGLKLKVTQLCINTAIIYMHRFYMIHSLKKFHHYIVATSCLFFACKVEEQPRRLREFIDIVQSLFHKSNEPINHNSEEYRHYGDQIMALESSLIQTLGFNVLINHAHTVIIKTCQMIKAPRDLAEAAYLTATNCLILTDFCVKFSSEKVACFCIYLACKWTGLVIPTSSEGMQWYEYVNHDIKERELEDISEQYLAIYGKCSNKIKKKLGITKNQDEINPQLHPKQMPHGHPQVRKPNPSHQHRQIPSSNVNTHQAQHPGQSHPNKQFQSNPHQPQQHTKNPSQQQHPGGPQNNGFHGNAANNHHQHNANQQRQQQFQQQQNFQQQQRPGHITNKQGPGGLPNANMSSSGASNSNHSGSHHNNPNKNSNVQTSKNMQHTNSVHNPNNSNFNNRSNFSNGTPSGSSSQSHSSHNLNNQTGASSSTSTKSNNNLNSGHGEGATINKNMIHTNSSQQNSSNNNNSNNNQLIKKSIKTEATNPSYNKMNGNNSSLNLPNHNIKSSPSNPQLNTSMKRGNEEISNNVSTAPNKIPKYVIDQKSAS